MKYNLIFLLIILSCQSEFSQAQISAPGSSGQGTTQYTNGATNDPIHVFCQLNGLGANPSLTATPPGGIAPYNYIWYIFDVPSNSWQVYNTQSNVNGPSTISNLSDGGYRVSIIDAGGNVLGCYRAWVWVKNTTINLTALQPGCTPFDLNAIYQTNNTFIYYNPPPDPFLVSNTTQIRVCFFANHTYVSDLGFFLVGPASCGSPTLALMPHPEAINAANGCCCNGGNNINNLCFTTTLGTNINPCTAGTPLTGTFSGYTSNFGGATNINWSAINGCDAAGGGWRVQIYDCIDADVGALTQTSIEFIGQSSCGQTTVTYNSGGINSVINDNSCSPATASIYTVPNPAAQQIPFTTTETFLWTANPAIAITNAGSASANVATVPTVDTDFRFTISFGINCSVFEEVQFQYQVPAVPVITPAGPFCSDAAAVTLQADVAGGTWTGNGITNAGTGLFNPTIAGAGTHTITYTTPPPCGSPSTIQIIVNPLPTIAETHTDISCFGFSDGSIDITVSNATPPLGFDWQPGSLAVEDPANLAAGNYVVTVTDANACVGTNSVTLVEPSAALNVTETHTDVSCGGLSDGDITLTVTGGTTPYTYTWNPAVSNNNSATNIPAGTYDIVVQDANLCQQTLQITVTEPPVLQVTETHTDVLCFGQGDGSIDVTVSGGLQPYTYGWSNATNTQDLTNVGGGTYSLIVGDFNNCQANLSVTITEPVAPLGVVFQPVDALCLGLCNGSVDATVSGGTLPYTFNWSNGLASEDIVNVCADVYTLQITDDNGCVLTQNTIVSEPSTGISVTEIVTPASCFGSADGAIDITVSGGTPPYSFSWNNNLGLNEDVTSLTAGSYTVTVTDATGICQVPYTYTVTEPSAVSVTASPNSTICISNSVTLNSTSAGGTPGYTVNWTANPADASLIDPSLVNPTVSPAQNTTYTVVTTDANGCVSQPSSITITLSPPLTITANVSGPNPICDGDNTTLTFTATGGDGSYTFTLGGNVVSSPLSVNPTLTTAYDITVADACGSPTDNASLTVNVNPLPLIQINAQPPLICIPQSVTFDDSATVPTSIAWNWDFGDPQSGAANNSTAATPSHSYNTPGLYTISLTVTSQDNCINSAIFPQFVTVTNRPTAAFTPTPSVTNVLEGEITLFDESVGSVEWLYTFPDGTTNSEQNPTYTFTDTGIFTITQVVTSAEGCTDVATEIVQITPVFNMYFPMSFTPNDNDQNEFFGPKGEGYLPDSFEMSVFNRWGQLIFRSKSPLNQWDGTFEGMPCQSGIYLYKAQLRSAEDFREKYFQGYVYLIR